MITTMSEKEEAVTEITMDDVDKVVERSQESSKPHMLMVPAAAHECISNIPKEIRDSPWTLYNYLIEKGYRCWFE